MATVIRGSDNFDSAEAGKVLQVVNFQTGSLIQGTVVIPHDDSIPQKTEGTEVMSLTITPTSASSKLKVEVSVRGAMVGGSYLVVALFQDALTDSLAASLSAIEGNNFPTFTAFTYYMNAGTTSATTFKVRAGPDSSGTMSVNGAGLRRFGGVSSTSITITEVKG